MRFGDYRLVAPLASGGMGGVYLASHITSGEQVALKVLDPVFASHPEVVARLFSERTISARASHPGLLTIHHASRNRDGVPFLVMEYLEGRTLESLAELGRLDIATIVAIGAQVASALAALHGAGIIHCDVKPANVFVLARQTCKVIDFGVSQFVDGPIHDDSTIAGTPAYMAPEQWNGIPTLASDVYALGCVIYELVTGEPPFEGSLPQLMLAHLEQRPARPSWLRRGIPMALERIILHSLAKDASLRPSMSELAGALAALVDAPADAPNAGETLRMAIAS